MHTPLANPADFNSIRFPGRPVANNIETLTRGWTNLPAVLELFGYKELRKGQDSVVASIMACRDTLCVLPTATGKSGAFIVPTLCLGWRTIVFSPLVALMRDQVQKLWKVGVKAAQMSSTQSDGENVMAARDWMSGNLQFLYIAPERLNNEWFKNAIAAVKPNMVVVDEAHTLSAWSDNFRPAYCKIGDMIRETKPEVVAAFTATCPDEVEADIRRVLCMGNANKLMYYPRRSNLNLMSRNIDEEYDVVKFIKSCRGQIVVYSSTIKMAEHFAVVLEQATGEEIGLYHGDLKPPEKRVVQDEFMYGTKRILVATNAFGMGVDKEDVRAVVHRNIPGTLEALAQEVGRAGRDGKPSDCMTFFDKRGLSTQQFFINCAYPNRGDVEKVFRVLQDFTDVHGAIKATHDQIGKAANVPIGAVSSILNILSSSAVIDKGKVSSKTAKIRFLGDSEDSRFKLYRGQIMAIGVEDAGEVEVDLNALASSLGVTYNTSTMYLKKWHAGGIIHYEPPFRGSEVRILGDLSRVEFDRLKLKQEQAYEKLEKVVEYCRIPDAQKHGYLEEYFGITAPQEG